MRRGRTGWSHSMGCPITHLAAPSPFFLTSGLPFCPPRAPTSSPQPEFTQQLQVAFILHNFKLLQIKEDHDLVHVEICKRERKERLQYRCVTHTLVFMAIKCQRGKKPCKVIPAEGIFVPSYVQGFQGERSHPVNSGCWNNCTGAWPD